MTMFNKDQIFQLLESRDGEALRALWQGRGAVDIAALLDSVEDSARQAAVFRTLPKDLAADVFSYLPGPTQATLARSFADGELQQIFDALHLDDAADFLEELPANLVTRILRSASPQRRMAVNALLRYPADSAGSVMTPEFVSLRPGDTVRQALDTIRRTGIHKETVYTCYVLEHRQLLGQLLGHPLPVGLVPGVGLVPEGGGFPVKGNGHPIGGGFVQQFFQHGEKPVNAVGVFPGLGGQQLDAVKGPVENAVAVQH